jgi:hypothetical protein|tara:strand:- start:265 stop:894 length:630 start_codon:yes stop_codon:yes gene_type:complete
MGWFSRNNEQPTQQFGAPSQYGAMSGGMGYGMQNGMMGGGMGGGMDPMQMQMMGQNPMMQQMANDPVLATARLLQHNDPIAAFIQTNQMGVMLDLIGEVITLALKDFFTAITLTTDEDGAISVDTNSLPSSLVSMSPENLRLTLQSLQSACQQQTQMNQQQIQMLLQAHNPMMNNQPGFFGSMLGGLLGNQMQQQGGMGAMGLGAAALV